MNFSYVKLKVFYVALNEKPEREDVQKKNVSLEGISLCVLKNLSYLFIRLLSKVFEVIEIKQL